MTETFSKNFSFDAKRQALFNGSLDILVPNLPREFDSFHVEVSITAIREGDNMLIGNVEKQIKTPPKKEPAAPKKEPAAPVKKAEPVVEEVPEQPVKEHIVHQNRDYRNYVNAVKRARRR